MYTWGRHQLCFRASALLTPSAHPAALLPLTPATCFQRPSRARPTHPWNPSTTHHPLSPCSSGQSCAAGALGTLRPNPVTHAPLSTRLLVVPDSLFAFLILQASNVLLARCSGAAAAVPARPGCNTPSMSHRFTAKVRGQQLPGSCRPWWKVPGASRPKVVEQERMIRSSLGLLGSVCIYTVVSIVKVLGNSPI